MYLLTARNTTCALAGLYDNEQFETTFLSGPPISRRYKRPLAGALVTLEQLVFLCILKVTIGHNYCVCDLEYFIDVVNCPDTTRRSTGVVHRANETIF
jgi:hypothetical protein